MSPCYQLQSVLIIFMLITINFVTSTDVSAVIHLILTGISVPLGLVFRRDRIVQTCDHSYVIIAIMLRITYCLSQMRWIQPGNRVSKRNRCSKLWENRPSRREFYFSNFFLSIKILTIFNLLSCAYLCADITLVKIKFSIRFNSKR